MTQRRRQRASWFPATVTIYCGWCQAAFRDMQLAQVHNTGKASLRCHNCGGFSTLPSDLLNLAEQVPADVDPDNPPGRAEAWEQVLGNPTLKRAMEIAVAGHFSLTYVGPEDETWQAVRGALGEWARIAQRCPCGNYMRWNRVTCTCRWEAIEAHRKSRAFRLALDSDLIVEASPVAPEDFYGESEPYTSVLTRISDYRLVTALGMGPTMDFLNTKHMGDRESFKLLREHKERWGLTPDQLVSVQRVAHTIAGLEGSQTVEARHVAEALSLRASLQET